MPFVLNSRERLRGQFFFLFLFRQEIWKFFKPSKLLNLIQNFKLYYYIFHT
jgi:hypothetical protein